MKETADTAQIREVRRLCRQFTADLYLRRGPFWGLVRSQRLGIAQYRYDIEAEEIEDGWQHENADWVDYDPPSPSDEVPVDIPPSLADPDATWRTPTMALSGLPEAQAILDGTRALYYSYEREFRYVPSQFRQVFFAGCLMYDPPADRLLEYADHANEWLRPRVPVNDFITIPMSEKASGLPIEWIPSLTDYRIAVEQVEREHWETYIAFLEKALSALLADAGIDAAAIIPKARKEAHIRQREKLVSTAQEQSGTDPRQLTSRQFLNYVVSTAIPHIRVDAVTSDDDVRKAFSFLRSVIKNERDREKRKRDDLTAIQCATWYDKYGWSHERIARYFGWAVQHPPAQMPRSETARKHIAAGRKLLRNRSSAPQICKHI